MACAGKPQGRISKIMGTKGREVARCSFDLLPRTLKSSVFSKDTPTPVPSLEARVLGTLLDILERLVVWHHPLLQT